MPVKCLRAAMYSPSGRQAGLLTRRKSSFVTCAAFVAVARPSPRRCRRRRASLVKAIRLPSGEKRGCISHAIAVRERRRFAALDRQRCRGRRAGRTRSSWPSGLTSTLIHVPAARVDRDRRRLAGRIVDVPFLLPVLSSGFFSSFRSSGLCRLLSLPSLPLVEQAAAIPRRRPPLRRQRRKSGSHVPSFVFLSAVVHLVACLAPSRAPASSNP